MEFPELGLNCRLSGCNRLEFLPIKCNGCSDNFCNDHWSYEKHGCSRKYATNIQVPVCPLCDAPVPTPKGTSPDVTVSAHIDRDCQSDPAMSKRSKIYTNRCSVRKCKQKEIIKIECDRCGKNFCLVHRHPEDHQCLGKKSGPKHDSSKAGQAAMVRLQKEQESGRHSPSTTRGGAPAALSSKQSFPSVQASQVSEDEALARALQASLADSDQGGVITAPKTQEEQNRMLAQAMAESQRDRSNDNGHSCSIT